jgi:hypothetical protein
MGSGRTDLKTSSDPYQHRIPILETKLAEWGNSFPFDAVLGAGQALRHAGSSVTAAGVPPVEVLCVFLSLSRYLPLW